MGSYADLNETSPSLGAKEAKLSPDSWSPGRSCGAGSYADQNETSLSVGAGGSETVATVMDSWEVERSKVFVQRDWPSLGAAKCKIVAAFVGPGEVQRSEVLCGSE